MEDAESAFRRFIGAFVAEQTLLRGAEARRMVDLLYDAHVLAANPEYGDQWPTMRRHYGMGPEEEAQVRGLVDSLRRTAEETATRADEEESR